MYYFRDGSNIFARRSFDLFGTGLMSKLKKTGEKSGPYVTNLNEFNSGKECIIINSDILMLILLLRFSLRFK